jgi:hypothetical protein
MLPDILHNKQLMLSCKFEIILQSVFNSVSLYWLLLKLDLLRILLNSLSISCRVFFVYPGMCRF